MSGLWLADSVLTPDERIENGYIYVSEGKIRSVGPADELLEVPQSVHRLRGCTLVPGFIDTHVHGGGGADTMDATPEALATIGRHLARHGVTAWLPTTMTNPIERIRAALDAIEEARRERAPGLPEILGAHMEGPYVNPKRKGAQPGEHIRPVDVRECLELCGEVVKVVTLAPEMPNGLDLVDALVEEGIAPSAGHSDATYEVMCAACARGLRAVTHGFNAQRGLHHREPGVIGTAMALPDMRVEIIADLVHVHKGAIAALWNAKGNRKLVLISDAMRAAGQPDGESELGGNAVFVKDGKALLADGSLAGSITNLGDEVRNLVTGVGMPLGTAVRMASANPAESLCLQMRKGHLAPGMDADFVALDAGMNIVQTVIRGEIAYEREAGEVGTTTDRML